MTFAAVRLPKPAKRSAKPRRPIARSRFKSTAASERRSRVRYCNERWRRLIYLKAPSGLCARCAKCEWHDAAHCFIKGRYAHIRFELENGAPLCRTCHRIVDSDHLAKHSFFFSYLGEVRYERLKMMAQARGKTDLRLMARWLDEECKRRGIVVGK